MSERVQQLLYEVQRAAAEEQYKVPLAERFPGANQQALLSLQREIAEEIAYSLGRAGRKVEANIRTLEGILTKRQEVNLAPEEMRELEDVFFAERRAAERNLRDLLIQREALGILRHDDVKQRYALPTWHT